MGTPQLLPALSENGQADLALKLFLMRTFQVGYMKLIMEQQQFGNGGIQLMRKARLLTTG